MGQDFSIGDSEIDEAWRVVSQLRSLAITIGVDHNEAHFLNRAAQWIEDALQMDDIGD